MNDLRFDRLASLATAFCGGFVVGAFVVGTICDPPTISAVASSSAHVIDPSGVVVENPAIAAAAKESPGVYRVLVVETGKPLATTVVTIGEGPAPTPPTPVPPGPGPAPAPALTGFALEVFHQAKALPPAECHRLADNYDAIASRIAAGGVSSLEEAVEAITAANRGLALPPATWAPFAAWIGPRFDRDAQTLGKAGELMAETAKGLRAVGGAR